MATNGRKPNIEAVCIKTYNFLIAIVSSLTICIGRYNIPSAYAVHKIY